MPVGQVLSKSPVNRIGNHPEIEPVLIFRVSLFNQSARPQNLADPALLFVAEPRFHLELFGRLVDPAVVPPGARRPINQLTKQNGFLQTNCPGQLRIKREAWPERLQRRGKTLRCHQISLPSSLRNSATRGHLTAPLAATAADERVHICRRKPPRPGRCEQALPCGFCLRARRVIAHGPRAIHPATGLAIGQSAGTLFTASTVSADPGKSLYWVTHSLVPLPMPAQTA